MACTPYRPVDGQFRRDLMWGLESSGQWSLQLTTANGQPASPTNPATVLRLLRNGQAAYSLTIHDPNTTRWIFFPGGTYLAVRDADRSGGDDNYHLWIFTLGSTVQAIQVGGNWTVPVGKQFHFQVSNDGLAFYVFCISSMPGTTNQNTIYRSDTLAPLLQAGTAVLDASQIPTARIATKADGSRWVQIWPDPLVPPQSPGPTPTAPYREAQLPSGKCVLSQTTLSFGDAIIDSPNLAERSRTMSVSLKNQGSDCLEIQAIGSKAPFTATASLPTMVAAGQQISCTVNFAPTLAELGPKAADLPITLVAADSKSDKAIHCEGNGRKSTARCDIGQALPTLEAVFGVNNTPKGTCSLKNGGGDSLQISAIQSIPGSQFEVVAPLPDFSQFLAANQQMTVTVQFSPTAVTSQPVEERLAITRSPQNGATEIVCRGTARLPHLGIAAAQPAPFSTYMYRRKAVTVSVSNTGEVPLELSATSSIPTFRCTNPGTVAPGASYPLSVEVYSDHLGAISGQVSIRGTFHLLVKSKAGAVLIDQTMETTATVTVSGTVDEMTPDGYEPSDSFETAIEVNLPLPPSLNPVLARVPDLNLDDRNGGADKDYFIVTYQSSPADDNCTGGGTSRLGMGVVITTYPPELSIRSKTKPELTDSGAPFARRLEVFRSNAHGRAAVTQTDGGYSLACPTRLFTDKSLYAAMSNPAYTAQGPIEYDMEFEYSPLSVTMDSSGRLTDVRFRILKEYYERIWLVDPPRGTLGEIVTAEQFAHGATIVVKDFGAFADEHAAVISQGSLITSLARALRRKAGSIIAADYLALAETCSAVGLAERAVRFYRKSADAAIAGGEASRAVTALRGLQKLYLSMGKPELARASESEARQLRTKGRTPTK